MVEQTTRAATTAGLIFLTLLIGCGEVVLSGPPAGGAGAAGTTSAGTTSPMGGAGAGAAPDTTGAGSGGGGTAGAGGTLSTSTGPGGGGTGGAPSTTSEGPGGGGAGGMPSTTGGGAGGMPSTTGGGAGGMPSTTGGGGTGGGGMGGGGPCYCASDADCFPPSIDCKQAVCASCHCEIVDVADGTPAPDQVEGDCLVSLCIGGAPALAPDDADVPDDGNDCTLEACAAGAPVSGPAPVGFPCVTAGGQLCDGGGTCVECLGNADCLVPQEQCVLHQCVTVPCQDGVKDGNETDVDCGGGACPPCAVGKSCGASSSNCVSTAYCSGGVCVAKAVDGTPCGSAGQCLSGNCVDGVCCQNACAGLCKACTSAKTGQASGVCANILFNTDPDNECFGAMTCGGGSCVIVDPGGCQTGAECASGFCVDFVCCNTACNGLCTACSAAKKGSGMNGTCGFIAQGTDPDNECPGALTCSSGTCN